MKTQTIKTMKLLAALLICLALFNVSCDSKKETTDTSKEEIKAPDMDIHAASFMGNLEMVKQHIKAGTDLNVKDQYGSTALMTATVFGKTEIAIALIDSGADLNILNNDGATVLHTASFLCRTDIVKALLEKGADKAIKNNFGSTALESVLAPFEMAKPIYDELSKALGPLGLKLDYKRLEETRPLITELLK